MNPEQRLIPDKNIKRFLQLASVMGVGLLLSNNSPKENKVVLSDESKPLQPSVTETLLSGYFTPVEAPVNNEIVSVIPVEPPRVVCSPTGEEIDPNDVVVSPLDRSLYPFYVGCIETEVGGQTSYVCGVSTQECSMPPVERPIILPPVREGMFELWGKLSNDEKNFYRRNSLTGEYPYYFDFEESLAVQIFDTASTLGIDPNSKQYREIFESVYRHAVLVNPEYINAAAQYASYYDQISIREGVGKVLSHEIMHKIFYEIGKEQEESADIFFTNNHVYIVSGKNASNLTLTSAFIRNDGTIEPESIYAQSLAGFEEILSDMINSLDNELNLPQAYGPNTRNELPTLPSGYLYVNPYGAPQEIIDRRQDVFKGVVQALAVDEGLREDFLNAMIFEPDHRRAILLFGEIISNHLGNSSNDSQNFRAGIAFMMEWNRPVMQHYGVEFIPGVELPDITEGITTDEFIREFYRINDLEFPEEIGPIN